MAVIESWVKSDLKRAVKVQYLQGNVFSLDNDGNLVGVNVFDDGEPATLAGSVSANVIRSDGTTVVIASGTLSENKASVLLPQAAYAVPGVISIIIKLTEDSTVTTLAAVVTNVYRSSTDTIVDPGTIMPSIQTLITEIETAVASIPADYSSLWTSLAPAYSTSATYAVGDYVTYNGGLYRCISAITSGESWTAAHWSAAKIGPDLSDLKSAIDEIGYGSRTYSFVQGKRNSTTPNAITSDTTRVTTNAVIECKAGDVISVDGTFTGVKYAIAGKATTNYDSGWKTDEFSYAVALDGLYFVNAAKASGTDVIAPSDIQFVVTKTNKTSIPAKNEKEISNLRSNFTYESDMIREGTKNLFRNIPVTSGNGNTSFADGTFTNVVADTGGTNKSLVMAMYDTSNAKEADVTGVGTLVVGSRYSTQFTKTSNSKFLQIKAGGTSVNLYGRFYVTDLENGNYMFSFECLGNTVGTVGGLVLDKFQIEKGTVATAYDDPYTAKDDVARNEAVLLNNNFIPSKNINGEWQLGGIEYSTGAAYGSDSNVRTGYIPVEKNKTYAFNISEYISAFNVYCFAYKADKTFISRIDVTYGLFPKVITIPDNDEIAYIRLNIQSASLDYSNGQAEENVMSTTYRPSTQKQIAWDMLPNTIKNARGKKVVVFGDSITAVGDEATKEGSGWTSYFKASVVPSEWHNYAVGGSNFCDYSSGNFLSEQIDTFLAANITDVDCFIIASGTNDSNITIPTDAEIEQQFYDNNMEAIPLADVDKTTWAGAFRYAVGKLRGNTRRAKIFVCTPLNRTYSSSEPVRSLYSSIKNKCEIIKKMCYRMGIECIDTHECGVDGSSYYLADGLHPKPIGARIQANYILARYMAYFNHE